MRGAYCRRLVASAALVLIIAREAPAQQGGMPDAATVESSEVAAAPIAAPHLQASPESSETSSRETPSAPAQGAAPELIARDAADRPIAERIRDLLMRKAERFFPAKKEIAAVEAFYRNRNYAPLWFDKGVENARAKSALARLKDAEADGLDRNDYRLPSLAAAQPVDLLGEAELKLTATVLTYARHLQAGRFPYNRVSAKNIELPQVPPEPADILARLSDVKDAGDSLDAFSPQNEAYRKLKATLAVMRAKSGVGEPNGPSSSGQIDVVIANMERWRWYPRDLGKAYVIVNEPDFSLRVVKDGAEVWTTRVVIGKASMQTPLLSETMKSITINPTWNVPPSIVHNEYLPALARDPTVLSRMGLRVHYGRGGVSISMPPGDSNALGRIRFNFPNRFLVYQHDTPDKYMFGHDVRAESHGCMRVQDPAKYAEALLNIARPDEHWTAGKVKGMFGSNEQDIALQSTPIRVHLTYQTAFVDDAGKLQLRRDVYGLDSRTLNAIRNDRALIETMPEGRHEPEAVASTTPRRSRRHSRNAFFRSTFFGDARASYAGQRPLPGVIYR